MSDIVIRVENLSKKYTIGRANGRSSGDGLRHAIQDTLTAPFRRLKRFGTSNSTEPSSLSTSDFPPSTSPLPSTSVPTPDLGPPTSDFSSQLSTFSSSSEDFWALKDVSFEVKSGEVLGIIGRNGAGKSTLLKILSRITEPSSGRIGIKGRVASLLEVGTGFHPELTGRENIYLNGAILGMARSEVRSKFAKIADFAEVERFLDTPVKHYSSGMYVRLAFAVAAHLEPDVLIIDEVLSVGDAAFQKKCLGKVQTVSAQEGRTVIFVSHQMGVVSAICQRCILLKEGRLTADGSAKNVIPIYLRSGAPQGGEVQWENRVAPQNERVRFHAVRIRCGGKSVGEVPLSSPVSVELEFQVLVNGLSLNVSFHLLDRLGSCILASGNLPSATLNHDQWGARPYPLGSYRSACEIPANFLNEDRYSISAFVVSNVSQVEVTATECLSFQTRDAGDMRKEYTGKWIGVIRPKLAWSTECIDEADPA